MMYQDETTGQVFYVNPHAPPPPLVYQNQQRRGGGGMNPSNMLDMMEMFSGGGGGGTLAGMESSPIMSEFSTGLAGGGGEGGFMSGLGSGATTAGYVGAAILGQHLLSRETDTEFEGVKTDDVFGGIKSGNIFDSHFMTEPWQGFLYDKIGFKPSPGERFDAAWENKDWGKMAKRAPAAAGYWANPGGSMMVDAAENIFGKKWGLPLATIADPIQGTMRWIEELF